MPKNGGFASFEIEYNTAGTLVNPSQEQALLSGALGKKHIICFSHGWNNDIPDARDLYDKFFTQVATVLPEFTIAPGDIALMLVLWPSKKFDEASLVSGDAPNIGNPSQGNAAETGSPPTDGSNAAAIDTAIKLQIEALRDAFGNDPSINAFLATAEGTLDDLGTMRSAQNDFVHALSAIIPASPREEDPGVDDARGAMLALDGNDVLQRIINGQANFGSGGSLGGSAALAGAIAPSDAISATGFDPIGSIKRAAWLLLNFTTYYVMKERAGVIGRSGVAQTLSKLLTQTSGTGKLHLGGHSFGGRLVTAAADALTGGSAQHQAASMSLFQAAYSHYGLASNYRVGLDGAFRSILTGRKVAGEIVITHSRRDLAVGLLYPLASAIARQSGGALGDANDFYGGMGRNGAQKTPEAFDDTLLTNATHYAPLGAALRVRNLNGDAIISEHGDIKRPETARALLQAMTGIVR